MDITIFTQISTHLLRVYNKSHELHLQVDETFKRLSEPESVTEKSEWARINALFIPNEF